MNVLRNIFKLQDPKPVPWAVRLVSALLSFLVIVPILAYVAYLKINPIVVFTLAIFLMPLAVSSAKQYILTLQTFYVSHYTIFNRTTLTKQQGIKLLLFSLSPTNKLKKDIFEMEKNKLLQRTMDWPAITIDMILSLSAGVVTYIGVKSFLLNAIIFPMYLALIGFLVSLRMILFLKQKNIGSVTLHASQVEMIKATLSDVLHKNPVSQFSQTQSSHSDIP